MGEDDKCLILNPPRHFMKVMVLKSSASSTGLKNYQEIIMTRKIHLIEKLGLFQKVDGNIYESGNWDISTQRADELIGGDIYFHKKQKETSFFGGKILGYRIYDN